MKYVPLIAAALLATTATTALAQRSAGTITGTIQHLPSAAAPARADLVLAGTATVVQSLQVAGDGAFAFRNVPFANYQIQIYSDGIPVATQRVDLQSAIPLALTIDATPTVQSRGVTVTEERVDRSRLGSATFFTAHALQELPVIDGAKRMEAALLATPGVVPDEDGRLHVRGEDAQL